MNFTYLRTIDRAYAGITIFMSLLSIVSCLLIIALLTACRSLRTNGRTLLVCLSIANIISCVASIIAAGVSVLIPDVSWSSFPVCAAASYISIISNICAYLWTCAISVYVYVCISWKRIELADKFRGPFHIVCWGFPVAVMVVATVSDVVGFDFGKAQVERRPPWCSIDRDSDQFIMWELVTGLGWKMATIVICTALYSLVQFSLSVQQAKTEENEQTEPNTDPEDLLDRLQIANRKLRHVPLIFVVLNAWGAWQEMASAVSSTPSWLVIMQVFGDHSQGFVNAILLFFLTKDVRSKLYIKCQSIRHFLAGRPSGPIPMELVHLSRDDSQLMANMDINDNNQVQG